MIKQNLIIYQLNPLYRILKELKLNLNFKITFVDSEDFFNDKSKESENIFVISSNKNLNIKNHFFFSNSPIHLSDLLERINIEFLKLQFNNQSQIKVGSYIVDINSRKLKKNNITLKLTEKEINIIIYLFKSKEPVSINELQKNIWSYQPNIETHTVETHIHRLRKKFFNTFHEVEFIISKNHGYIINH